MTKMQRAQEAIEKGCKSRHGIVEILRNAMKPTTNLTRAECETLAMLTSTQYVANETTGRYYWK